MEKGTKSSEAQPESKPIAPITEQARQAGGGFLQQLPPKLQKMVVDEILKMKIERATDIWYCDQATGRVWIMRHNIHWQLNETASAFWVQLGEGPIAGMVEQIHGMFPGAELEELRIHFAEFLLNAYNNGLITIPG